MLPFPNRVQNTSALAGLVPSRSMSAAAWAHSAESAQYCSSETCSLPQLFWWPALTLPAIAAELPKVSRDIPRTSDAIARALSMKSDSPALGFLAYTMSGRQIEYVRPASTKG